MTLAKDYFFQSMIDTANMLSMQDCIKDVLIVESALRENCGIIGAATLAIQEVFNGPRVK